MLAIALLTPHTADDDDEEEDYFVWSATQAASTTPQAGASTPAAIEAEFRAAIGAVKALLSRKVISCENPRARAMMAEEPMVRLVKIHAHGVPGRP